MIGNAVTLAGNLTKDPEHFAAKNGEGAGVTRFSIANNRRWNDRQGNQREEVSFFDCVAFGDLGTNVLASLAKGTRVLVEARAHQSTWEAEDGTKRSKVEFVVDDVAVSLRWAQVPQVVKTSGPAAAKDALVTATGGTVVEDGSEPF